MTNDPTRNASPREVLSVPNFRHLWLGQVGSEVGNGLTRFAVLLMINKLTGSAAAVATMAVALALPRLVFGLPAGFAVDRWSRRDLKRTLIVCDLLCIPLLLAFIPVRHQEQVWLFYLLGFLQAAVGTLWDPTEATLLPWLVPRNGLLAANSVLLTTRIIAGVVGAALAGVLVGQAGSGWPAFALDAFSCFVSALFLSRILVPSHAPVASSAGREISVGKLFEGVRLIATQRTLAAVVLALAVNMLGVSAVNVLSIPFLVNVLGARSEAVGTVAVAKVLGMLLGSALVTGMATRLKSNQMLGVGVCGIGILLVGIGAARSMWGVLLGTFCAGVCAGPVQAAAATLLQTMVPDDRRGRVRSALDTIVTTASVVSMAASGILGDALGIRNVFYFSGAITVVAGLLCAPLIRIRSLPDSTP